MDVWLDGDRIARVAPPDGGAPDEPATGNVETLDATGLIVAPGFIDLHCHLREPGGETSETIETGTRAAARGGFTAVCPMPNTRPVNDNASVTRAILERAAAAGNTRVWPIGAASAGSRGEALAEIAAMQKAGIVGRERRRPAHRHGQAAAPGDGLLPGARSAGDRSLRGRFALRRSGDARGPQSVRLGLRGMPAATESIAVARDIQIAELTGCRLHIAHLSARASLELVRAAKQRGLRVSCEVTPHHFTLTDEDVGYDTHFKMNPPLAPPKTAPR